MVAGKVMDNSGKPIENFVVEFIVEREVINVGSFNREVVGRKVFTTETDRDGTFYFTWNVDNYYNRFYLNYFVKDKFDDVKFMIPEEPMVDVSKSVGKMKNFEDQRVLAYHPDWFNLLKIIDQIGVDTNRGKILRKWGIYERQTDEEIAGKTYTFWWYYLKGKAFKFENDNLVKEFTYKPMKPVAEE
ncbi:MAG: hypothetical protein JW737_04205 [Acidobacteria bacterium]|nr:hypothetical protein [Acidobacteriota bacterium]